MVKSGLFLRLEVKGGKEAEIKEFLNGGDEIAAKL